MLKTIKTTNYEGIITIDGAVVANLYCTVNEDGSSTYNRRLPDQATYDAHKEEIQKEITEFEAQVEKERDK
ncbi:hypothetical protein ACNAN0_02550 [Agrilactobacillus fermenti]|uniref:hypothetical protein n=1 Tax=Agrilactobacillus fermenti TaxID=2586909 RepID=UPI001E54DBED|nr:hypothetical protein [Agrilactobacillus fermenti]MCD2256403.1 hypothetical protein [Agrilactobacillus fermenti]